MMKSSLFFLFAFLTPIFSQAVSEIPVQRTTQSSLTDYLHYLEKNKRLSFVEGYIRLSSVTEMETPFLENCLEEIYLGAPAKETCLSAVKSLTSIPLNQPRREVLFSFLSKLEKIKSQQQSIYRDFRTGLLRTHPDLGKIFQVQATAPDSTSKMISDLEMKAWKKALQKIFHLSEVALLINGKKVANLESWSAPNGVYQWALVSNTHGPIIKIGTFSQFAIDSLKGLRPLASGTCEDLDRLEPEKFGFLRLEVFGGKKCIASFGAISPIGKVDHLGSASKKIQMESSSLKAWAWPLLILAGVGLANSLKDKQVQVSWPSLR